MGLPVHRHVHQDQSSVYAFTDELNEWLSSRTILTSDRGQALAAHAESASSHAVRVGLVRGRYLLSTRMGDALLASVREFQSAIAHDPTEPLSYAALAEAYCALSGNEVWRRVPQGQNRRDQGTLARRSRRPGACGPGDGSQRV